MHGVFAINKPPDISSAQVLRDLQTHFNPSRLFAPSLAQIRQDRQRESRFEQRKRSRAKQKIQVKLGHGGTLDPMATGVLIIGVGSGTKELSGFLHGTKRYTAEVLFGAATDTYDTLGRVVRRAGTRHLSGEVVKGALGGFRGKGKQRPPVYSALRMEGKRLYEYAREGKMPPMEIQEREVEVKELEMVAWREGPEHGFRIPEKEAEPQEKAVLDKVIHAVVDGETVEKEGEGGGKVSGVKRKHGDSVDWTLTEDAGETKRQKGDEEPMMSGALQDEAAKDIEDTSYSNTKQPSTTHDPEELTPVAKLHMSVSSGFYVRSLCQELGEAVDSAAMMASLVRTQQADFELGKNVFEYSELAKGEDVWAPQIKNLLDAWNSRETQSVKSPPRTGSPPRTKSPHRKALDARSRSPLRAKSNEPEKTITS